MNYTYNGTINFSRPVLPEEQNKILSIFNALDQMDITSNYLDIYDFDSRDLHDELNEMMTYLKKRGIGIDADSQLHYSGDGFGVIIFHKDCTFEDVDPDEASISLAADETLEAELARRHPGDITKQRVVEILRKYIDYDAALSSYEHIYNTLSNLGVTNHEFSQLGLEFLTDLASSQKGE